MRSACFHTPDNVLACFLLHSSFSLWLFPLPSVYNNDPTLQKESQAAVSGLNQAACLTSPRFFQPPMCMWPELKTKEGELLYPPFPSTVCGYAICQPGLQLPSQLCWLFWRSKELLPCQGFLAFLIQSITFGWHNQAVAQAEKKPHCAFCHVPCSGELKRRD